MTVTSQDGVLTSSTPATATFYSQQATEVVATLGSDEASGLTVAEAASRLGFMQRGLQTQSLDGLQWLACLGLALILPVVVEVDKWIRRRHLSAPAASAPVVVVSPGPGHRRDRVEQRTRTHRGGDNDDRHASEWGERGPAGR